MHLKIAIHDSRPGVTTRGPRAPSGPRGPSQLPTEQVLKIAIVITAKEII